MLLWGRIFVLKLLDSLDLGIRLDICYLIDPMGNTACTSLSPPSAPRVQDVAFSVLNPPSHQKLTGNTTVGSSFTTALRRHNENITEIIPTSVQFRFY